MGKIYVAGSSSELDLCASWMQRLRDAGHGVTLDWPANIRAVGDANPRDASHDDRERWSLDDLNGVFACDVFWLLIPEKPSMGCWLEFGVALKTPGLRHIVSGDWRKSIFTSLADYRFDSHSEAFEHLTGRREAAQ